MKTKSVISLLTLLSCISCVVENTDEDMTSVESEFEAKDSLLGGTIVKGPIFDGPIILNPIELCLATPVTPDLATDGQRVYLSDNVAKDTRAFLRGFRYNDAPPTDTFPNGEGREQMFCGCQRVKIETISGVDGETISRPYITVPLGAPTGDYSVDLQPVSGECPAVADGAVCPEATACVAPTLAVAPSYLVAKSLGINLTDNAEDSGDHPAEVTFTFAGLSGTPASPQDPALITWSGTFPGGPNGRNHISHADNTRIDARIPLFVGQEAMMKSAECFEECKSLPQSSVVDCTAACTDYTTKGRFNDRFDFSLGGMEWDSSPSKGWGVLAGVVASVATCLASAKLGVPTEGCGSILGLTGAAGVGGAVATKVNEMLEDNDDHLGVMTGSGVAFSNDWNVGANLPTAQFGGDQRTGGNIKLDYKQHRVAAPRILNYSVKFNSIKLLDGHERPCDGANDIIVDARAMLYQGDTQLPASERFPAIGNWPMRPGDVKVPPMQLLASDSYTADTAPESPFIYVEFAVWDEDGGTEIDLIGAHADTLFLGELLAGGTPATDSYNAEGYPVRKVTVNRKALVNGYNSSEQDCSIWASGWNAYTPRGRAELDYTIELTWLKAPPRN